MIGLDYFKNLFPSDAQLNIFDVGAHHGNTIKELLDCFPASIVHAFEPDADNFSELSKRFKDDSRVKIIQCAISNSNGKARLHRNNYDATHSLLPINDIEINRWADSNDFFENGVNEVETVSIDEYCRANNINIIDILKLDIQGGELLAFEGAENLLVNQSVGCIFTEVEFRPLYKNQPLFWDISDYLISKKYQFVNFIHPKVSEMGVLSWADAIFINEYYWESIASKHSAGKRI